MSAFPRLADAVEKPTIGPRVYDATELAAVLKISSRHLRRLVDAGLIPGVIRLGRSVRFNANEIDSWIQANCPRLKRK